MGLFSFMREAGERVLGKKDEAGPESAAGAQQEQIDELRRQRSAKFGPQTGGGAGMVGGPHVATGSDAPRNSPDADFQVGQRLEGHVRQLGLDIADLRVVVDDGTAIVSGSAKSTADREKAVLAVGNTVGIGKVDDRIVVGAPQKGVDSKFYTVQEGDTLSKIAKAEYGDTSDFNRIYEANRPMLKSPDRIYPGQVLRIPPNTN